MNVTARQATEAYGFQPNRSSMICCPFHADRNPSMKVDSRFHCFGCGVDGDVIDFTAKLFQLSLRQAAEKLATDFGLSATDDFPPICYKLVEKPLAASTFIHHLKDNQKSLGIVYDDKCIGTNRGFHNVDIDLFLPVDVPSPWD